MSAWIEQIFQAGQAGEGNIVRRSRADVEKYASVEELVEAVTSRGFHLIEIGTQLVVICNRGAVQLLV